ncbi:hypothetical protein ARMGADRAFT_1172011 [Armillaria gallica]|uniref:Uncharacterized protein n=1 Tax=Armillaria gallica TaxID=47427 RepID=A0A2H3CEG5_ARMGA|nr:hypothetical protein ARMGADRAFT_1172011 [Armillaria gallica]
MSPAVDSSAKEAPEPTDELAVVVPVPVEDIQPETVTQSSDDPPVVEDAGEAQCPSSSDGDSDTKVDEGIDPDNSFGPPPLPGVIPKGPVRGPVAGGPKKPVKEIIKPDPRR